MWLFFVVCIYVSDGKQSILMCVMCDIDIVVINGVILEEIYGVEILQYVFGWFFDGDFYVLVCMWWEY